MQQFTRNLRQIDPLVQHGLREIQSGAPVDHILREVALMGTLVGSGMNVNQAIRAVEQVERQILSYGGYERVETQFHRGAPGQAGYGKQAGYGMQQGYGMQPSPYGQAGAPYGAPMGGGMWMGQ